MSIPATGLDRMKTRVCLFSSRPLVTCCTAVQMLHLFMLPLALLQIALLQIALLQTALLQIVA